MLSLSILHGSIYKNYVLYNVLKIIWRDFIINKEVRMFKANSSVQYDLQAAPEVLNCLAPILCLPLQDSATGCSGINKWHTLAVSPISKCELSDARMLTVELKSVDRIMHQTTQLFNNHSFI